MTVDLGPLGTRRSVAALASLLRPRSPPRPTPAKPSSAYAREALLGRQVVCVANFPPLRVAGVASEVLVLGAIERDGRVVLLMPDAEAELGSPIA